MNENTNMNHVVFPQFGRLSVLLSPPPKKWVTKFHQEIIEIIHLIKHFTELRFPIAIHSDSKPPIEVLNPKMRWTGELVGGWNTPKEYLSSGVHLPQKLC